MAHPCVKEYLKFVREEQAQQPLQPRQAVPLFYDKFTGLIAYLRGLIAAGSVLSPLDKYLLVRDVTFFVVDFYTGDRASDLGRVKADQLFRLRDRGGGSFLTLRLVKRGVQVSYALLLCYVYQMYLSARFFG